MRNFTEKNKRRQVITDNIDDVDKAQAVVNDGFAVMYELLKKAADAFTDDNTNRAHYFIECMSDTCYAIKDKIDVYEKALEAANKKEGD